MDKNILKLMRKTSRKLVKIPKMRIVADKKKFNKKHFRKKVIDIE